MPLGVGEKSMYVITREISAIIFVLLLILNILQLTKINITPKNNHQKKIKKLKSYFDKN